MRILISLVVSVVLIVSSYYLFFTYRSAFEADQQCHFDMKVKFNDLLETGCDHDMETSQWILFQKGDEDNPSKVIRRYRY